MRERETERAREVDGCGGLLKGPLESGAIGVVNDSQAWHVE